MLTATYIFGKLYLVSQTTSWLISLGYPHKSTCLIGQIWVIGGAPYAFQAHILALAILPYYFWLLSRIHVQQSSSPTSIQLDPFSNHPHTAVAIWIVLHQASPKWVIILLISVTIYSNPIMSQEHDVPAAGSPLLLLMQDWQFILILSIGLLCLLGNTCDPYTLWLCIDMINVC